MKKVGGENALADGEYDVKTLINVEVGDGEVTIVDENGDGDEKEAAAT
jgi:adenine phosphoribosyltransferase